VNAAYEIGSKQTVRGGSSRAADKNDRRRASDNEQSRRMLVALALLMIAIAVVAFRDRQYLFDAEPSKGQATTQQATIPAAGAGKIVAESNTLQSNTPSNDAVAHVAAVPAANQSTPAESVSHPIPSEHQAASARPNTPAKHTAPIRKDSAAALTAQAAQKARVAEVTVQEQQAGTVLYPRLDQRTKVEGSVELQALVGTDGTIQELHVVRGPAVLGSAAREAVLQWKFKPYVENGVAVETYARITVNFTIKVMDGSPKTVASVEPEHVIILADNYQR